VDGDLFASRAAFEQDNVLWKGCMQEITFVRSVHVFILF
jgi:hypothetical protein